MHTNAQTLIYLYVFKIIIFSYTYMYHHIPHERQSLLFFYLPSISEFLSNSGDIVCVCVWRNSTSRVISLLQRGYENIEYFISQSENRSHKLPRYARLCPAPQLAINYKKPQPHLEYIKLCGYTHIIFAQRMEITANHNRDSVQLDCLTICWFWKIMCCNRILYCNINHNSFGQFILTEA